MKLTCILFDGFETLDAFGPVEIFGWLPEEYPLIFCSAAGGIVTSSQNVRVETIPFSEADTTGSVLLIPGGQGTRALVNDVSFLDSLADFSKKATFTLTVCTGSVLLAKTGLLDGRYATSNKRAFDWVQSTRPAVRWVRSARWTVDGPFYTSSGVSAGMDMALGFLRDRHGSETAQTVAATIEYRWNANPDDDPFSG